MNSEFTVEQEGFRQEVRAFLDAELLPGWLGYTRSTINDAIVDREDGWIDYNRFVLLF